MLYGRIFEAHFIIKSNYLRANLRKNNIFSSLRNRLSSYPDQKNKYKDMYYMIKKE